nr:PspC domain-containing protein [uncultured Mucilaginibacter sp.]
MEKRLYRDELNKKIAGVCAGLAEYLSVDVTVVRVIFVLALVLKGVGFLPYVVLWIVLPKKPYHLNNPHVDYTVPPSNEPFNPFRAGAGTPPFNAGVPPFAVKPPKNSSAGLIAGVSLVLFGSFFLLEQLDIIPFLSFHQLWPVILIVTGAMIIFTGKDKTPKPVDEPWEATEKKDEAIPTGDTAADKTSTEQ